MFYNHSCTDLTDFSDDISVKWSKMISSSKGRDGSEPTDSDGQLERMRASAGTGEGRNDRCSIKPKNILSLTCFIQEAKVCSCCFLDVWKSE